LYDSGEMTLPKISDETKKYYPELALASTRPWPYFGISASETEECKLAYFASISFVDAQIGRLLNALDSLRLSENTIVVFWSDHGYHLGEHGLWFKQSCFEESAKCPLIISVPGLATSGKLCRKPVELVDIYPTLAELTGLKPPEDLEGYSLAKLLRNPEAAWDHPAYTQVQRGDIPGHSIRTQLWRYTEWDFGNAGAELYNEESDPLELNNLAGNEDYKDVVAQMKELLKKVHPVYISPGIADPETREKFSN
jgi:iduronate 2-sulfatase